MAPKGNNGHDYAFVGSQVGIVAFVTTVVGYTITNRLLSASSRLLSSSSSSTSRIKALPTPSDTPSPPLPFKVGLLDLPVPSRRSKQYTNILLANDISVEKAVQAVSDTLYIYLEDDPKYTPPPLSGSGYTPPELRCYLSELYGQLWDVCYLHKNLQLDVRILYNTTAAGNAKGASITREEALMKPELQVVFCQKTMEIEKMNRQRQALGLPSLTLHWLDDHIKVALTASFYYLEDDQSHIPHFRKVAVGGTFDRLHNGHKKLLSLAACVCEETLTIGITSAEMLAKKRNAAQIECVEDRIDHVRSFLESVFPHLNLNIIVLKDPFGPPVHDEDYDAIVVSSETIAGAVKINDIRASKGMKHLQVVVTRRTVSSLLSSSFIRNNVPPRPSRSPPPGIGLGR